MEKLKENTIKLLRWSEKYTKTDMVYFAHNGAWVLLGQITVAGAAFLTTLVLAHSLSKELFGQYRFIITIIPIIGLFTLSSLGNALMRSVARGHKVDWGHLLRTKIHFGLIAMFTSFILATYYLTKGNLLLVYIYIIVGICIIFYDLFLLYNNYLQGTRNFKYASLYLGTTRLVQAILIITVAVTTHNIFLIIVSFFIGLILPQLFFYIRTRKLHTVQIVEKEPEQGLIKYSIQLTSVAGLILITGNLDKLFTWHYLGAEQFAVYAIALTLPLNILLLFNFIPQIYFPNISTLTLDTETRIKIIKRIFLMLITLSGIALLYALVSPWLLPLFFTTYADSIPVTIILAVLIPLLPANTILSQTFQVHNMLKYIIALRILLTVIFSIAFSITYITSPTLAAAFAFVISEFTILILGLIFLRYARLKN